MPSQFLRDGSAFLIVYERRARRILVPYLLVLVVSSCLFGIDWTKHWYWYAFFGTNFAGALQQFGHYSLQPLWSLAVEEQFYLVWPIVILMVPERALVRIAVAILFIAPLLRGLATPLFSTRFPIYFLTPFRMDLLCAGAILAIIWRNRQWLIRRFRLPAYGCFITMALLLLWVSRYPQFRTGSNTVLANTFLFSIILFLVTSLIVIALSGEGLFAVCFSGALSRTLELSATRCT
jgi:peptidoglycan/LPS O-acetylase OafA/YrhL